MEYKHYILKALKNEYECNILSDDLDSSIIEEIKDYIFDYLNDTGFFELNGKDVKVFGFRGYDGYYNLGQIELNSFDAFGIAFLIKLIRTIDDINPFSLISSNVFENSDLKINYGYRLTQSDINAFLNEENEYVVKSLIEAILSSDGNVFIYSLNKELLFWYEILGLLIPKKHLYNISFIFSLDYFDFSRFKIAYGIKNANESVFDFEEFNKRYDYEIGKYISLMLENLNDSLKNSILFKDKIDFIMQKNNYSLDECVDVYNLITGRISMFPMVGSLSRAIELAKGISYDKKEVSAIIFTSLGKYEICNDILIVYELLYENLEISRDYIISAYFKNLNFFGISGYNSTKEYLHLVDSNCPFPLVDYYDYLKKYELFDDFLASSYENLYDGYLLLELEARSIIGNKSIVPNDTFLYFINSCIINKDISRLDVVLNRIRLVNKKAPFRLLDIQMSKIIKNYRNILDVFDLKLLFLLCERLAFDDAAKYLYKCYNSISDRRIFIDYFLEREKLNPSYYSGFNEFIKDNELFKGFLDLKEQKAVYVNKSISFDDLKEIYKNIYLDKNKLTSDVFYMKVNEYLDSLGLDMKLDACVNIFNEFYKPLPYTYKDLLDSIRRLNDYVYKYPELLIKHDRRYFKLLYEMNNILSKVKSSINPYYYMVKRGLEYKEACINENTRALVFDAIRAMPYFNDYNEEMVLYFIRYQIKDYLVMFFNYLPNIRNINNENYSDFLNSYKLFIDPISDYKGFGHAVRDILGSMNQNEMKRHLFLYSLMALSNKERYKKIFERIISDIDKKELKSIFNDYLKILDSEPFKGKIEAVNFKNYIVKYFNDSKFSIKKLFKKK